MLPWGHHFHTHKRDKKRGENSHRRRREKRKRVERIQLYIHEEHIDLLRFNISQLKMGRA